MTPEKKVYPRLERRKIRRIKSGKRFFNSAEERDRTTALFQKVFEARMKINEPFFNIGAEGQLQAMYTTQEYACITKQDLKNLSTAFKSGGSEAVMRVYMDMVMKNKTKIEEYHKYCDKILSKSGIPSFAY